MNNWTNKYVAIMCLCNLQNRRSWPGRVDPRPSWLRGRVGYRPSWPVTIKMFHGSSLYNKTLHIVRHSLGMQLLCNVWTWWRGDEGMRACVSGTDKFRHDLFFFFFVQFSYFQTTRKHAAYKKKSFTCFCLFAGYINHRISTVAAEPCAHFKRARL